MFGSKMKRVRIIGSRPYSLSGQLCRARLEGKREYREKNVEIIGMDKEYPYWKESGWRKIGKVFKGYYETDYGKWYGMVEETYGGNYSFFILKPPYVLKNGAHGDCFSYKGNGKYSIHFSQKPEDISSGILTVEQLITELFEKDRKGGQQKWQNGENIKEFILTQLKKI